MILLAYGVLHRNAAVDLVMTMGDADFEEKSKLVANYLCRAAGVFEFLRGEAGRWLVKPDPLFTELKDETLSALASLSMAEAQLCAVKKAALKASSDPVMAKLCMDAMQKYDSAVALLTPMTNPYEPGLLTVSAYATATSGILKALALKYKSVESAKATKHGVAVGYITAALSSIPEDKSRNMKHLEWVYSQVRAQRADIQRIFDVYTNDNNTIYFEPVPDPKTITLPEGAGFMKAIAYVTPPASMIQFIPKKDSGCVVQ